MCEIKLFALKKKKHRQTFSRVPLCAYETLVEAVNNLNVHCQMLYCSPNRAKEDFAKQTNNIKSGHTV